MDRGYRFRKVSSHFREVRWSSLVLGACICQPCVWWQPSPVMVQLLLPPAAALALLVIGALQYACWWASRHPLASAGTLCPDAVIGYAHLHGVAYCSVLSVELSARSAGKAWLRILTNEYLHREAKVQHPDEVSRARANCLLQITGSIPQCFVSSVHCASLARSRFVARRLKVRVGSSPGCSLKVFLS